MPTLTPDPPPAVVVTDVPARLDRLPWGRFHWLFVAAFGVTWAVVGLEVTVVGAVGFYLLETRILSIDEWRPGLAQAGYLVGAIGARWDSGT